MEFSERIKELRIKSGLTQEELGKAAGITGRTIQNYELGTRIPKDILKVQKIAAALGVTTEKLLGEGQKYVIDAAEKGGYKAKRDMTELVTEISGLFAGGELSEDDRDAALQAINAAYWKAKENNKKYTPKSKR